MKDLKTGNGVFTGGVRGAGGPKGAPWRAALGALLLVLIGVGVWLNSLNAIPRGDDMIYSFILEPDFDAAADTQLRPIGSMADMVESQRVQYAENNGRVPVHVLVQLFDGFHAHRLFALLNALVFCLTVAVMYRFSRPKRGLNLFLLTLIAFSMLFLMPEAGRLYSLPSSSVNYLWVLLLSLFALYVWRRRLYLWAPVMFIAGWSHEAFAVPIAATMGVSLLFHPREILGRRGLIALFYFAGAVFLVFSPGNFMRLETLDGGWSALMMVHRVGHLFMNGWVDLLLGCLLVYRLRNGRAQTRRYLTELFSENGFLVGVIVFTLLFLFVIGSLGGKGFFSLSAFAMILFFRLTGKYVVKADRPGIYLPLMAVLLALDGAVTAADAREKRLYDRAIEAYIKDPDGLVAIPEGAESGLLRKFGLTNAYEWQLDTENDYRILTARLAAPYYGHPARRPLLLLPAQELQALRNPGPEEKALPDSTRTLITETLPGTARARRVPNTPHLLIPVPTDTNPGSSGPSPSSSGPSPSSSGPAPSSSVPQEITLTYDFSDPTKLSFKDRLKLKAGRLPASETFTPLRLRVGDRFYDLVTPPPAYTLARVDIVTRPPA